MQCDRNNKVRHSSVTHHLVDRTAEVIHLMNQDLQDLIHDGIGLFRIELFRHGSKSHQITKHDSDLLAFAFDAVLLGQDFQG